jgi:hypothetical protein
MATSPTGSFYRHLIRNAWKAVRSNPLLWIFGFFVSFLGNGGIYELLVQGTGRLGLQQDFGGLISLADIIPSGSSIWRSVTGAAGFGLAIMMVVATLALIVIAVVGWAVVSSQGALITGVRDAAKGGRRHTFASLFNLGREVFWPLLTLDVLSRVAVAAFFYLLLSFLLALIAQPSALLAAGYLLAFLILIPATLVIGFVTIYAACHLVLYRSRLVEAIETAVALFMNNWLINLETAALLFAINVAVSVAVGLAIYVLSVVGLIVFGFSSALTGSMAWIVLVVGGVIAVMALAFVGAGLAAFQYSVWTELFLKLNKPGHGAIAKLARWWHRVFGR